MFILLVTYPAYTLDLFCTVIATHRPSVNLLFLLAKQYLRVVAIFCISKREI